MKTIFIKFLTREDRVPGFYELITHTRVDSFRGEIYQVSLEALKLLENRRIGYRLATDDEVKSALFER